MTWYSIIHGPEFWLALAVCGVGVMIFDLGLLAGLWLAALFRANREDCGLPPPGAEEGGPESPHPRRWRAVAEQDRERQMRKGVKNDERKNDL